MKRYSQATWMLIGSLCMLNSVLTHAADRNFGADVEFLSQHVKTVVLGKDPQGPRVAVVPAYQGRVMTSTASGDQGTSYGWINYDHIASGQNCAAHQRLWW